MRLYAASLVLLCVVMGPSRASAQNIEVTPFLGWETAGSYPVTDSTDIQALRADANKTFGVTVDYPLTKNVDAEFLWADNSTTYSAQSVATGEYTPAFNARIDQYQFGAMYLFGDDQSGLRPFIVGSIGWTHDSANGANPGRSAVGFGMGGGVKYGISTHLGIRAEARWMPTYGNSGIGTFCDTGGYGGYGGYDPYGYGGYDPYGGYGGGCYQDTVHNYLQRFNVLLGVTIGL